MSLPDAVRIMEMGPRDGLQNERRPIDVATRVALIEALDAAGLDRIEVGSFVSPRAVPQMQHTDQVLAALPATLRPRCTVLVPNAQGLAAALAAGAGAIAVFASASEGFSRANINCTVAESLARFAPLVAEARAAGLPVRGYVSCIFDCPYDGPTPPGRVLHVAGALAAMGCAEISLGDTIGTGTPLRTASLIAALAAHIPLPRLALHCHDTYGMALANILAALQAGVTVFDASVSGLGGCPYAPGATGNVATEDLVYMLHGMGIATGIDLAALRKAGALIDAALDRPTASRTARALQARALQPAA